MGGSGGTLSFGVGPSKREGVGGGAFCGGDGGRDIGLGYTSGRRVLVDLNLTR